MNENQFSAMLALIVPPIIKEIAKNSNILVGSMLVIVNKKNSQA